MKNAPKEGMGPLAGILEAAFLEWNRQITERLGLNPNPDDPRHFYDSRALFLAGPEHWPRPETDWHGESRFKLRGHPNRFVEGEDTLRGGPAKKAAKRANERQYRKVMKRYPDED